VTAIAAGGAHSLALKRDGSVVAWEDDTRGQMDMPAGLSGVIAIAAGNAHSLALVPAAVPGTPVAWPNYGQANVPLGLNDGIAVASGGDHGLALKRDGSVVAWGYNQYGQLNVPVAEDAGPYSAAWATAITPGPVGESGQALSFILTNNNTSLFSSQPALAPDGTLTFTLAPNETGSATVTVVLKDDGGTNNGGVDSAPPRTFTITVTPVTGAQPPGYQVYLPLVAAPTSENSVSTIRK
jgi:hypothetical protein